MISVQEPGTALRRFINPRFIKMCVVEKHEAAYRVQFFMIDGAQFSSLSEWTEESLPTLYGAIERDLWEYL